MARKFDFSSNENILVLEIAGEEFEVDVMDHLWLQKVDEGKKKLKESGDNLSEFSKKEESAKDFDGLGELMKESIGICVDVLNDLLGEGAAERIFKDRVVRFLDAVDVIHFVFQQADDYMKNGLTNKFGINRAQRRGRR